MRRILPTIGVVVLVTISAFAQNTSPVGYLDVAVNASNGSTTLPPHGTLLATGWAADLEDTTPVSRIEVRIDGVSVGNATLGGSRPDIGTMFGSSAFSNAGWSFTYNIGTLSLGTHAVTAVAYDSASASIVLTNTLSITVANASPVGYAESAVNVADGTGTVPQMGTVRVIGWAVDAEDKAPVTRVEVRIDGTAVGNATLGSARPDIATLFGSNDFLNAGWSFTYNVGMLAAGTHTVSAVAYDSFNAATTLTLTPTFAVSGSPPVGYLDQAYNLADGTNTLPPSATLQATGWTIDFEDKAPVSRVEVRIDGSAVGNATLGSDRPDIASAFGSNDYLKAGWSFNYAVSGLSPGTHNVTAVAYDSNGAYTTLTNTFPVQVCIPQITSLSPNRGGIGTSVTINGSCFGPAIVPNGVKFGTTVATVTNSNDWTNTAIAVQVPQGLTTGTYNVTVTCGSSVSNAVTFTVPAASLIVTPSQVSMAVGETQVFQVLNSGGAIVSATFSIDDTSVAAAAADPSMGFEAKALGTTTLRASTTQGDWGSATINVLAAAGQPLPAGTERWSAPNISGVVRNIVQSLKVDADTPDLYVQDSAHRLRGIIADGTQKWLWNGYAILQAADNTGGALITTSSNGWALSSIDKSGHQAWTVNIPGWGTGNGIAVHPNSTVFAVSQPQDANGVAMAFLTGYNGDTGQPIPNASVAFPRSMITYNYTNCSGYTSTTGPGNFFPLFANGVFNPVVIGPDGTAFAVGVHLEATYNIDCTNSNPPGTLPANPAYTYNAYMDLVSYNPDPNIGSHVRTIDSVGGSATGSNWNLSNYGFGAVIPDGSGGAIIAARAPTAPAGTMTIFRSSSTSIPSPFGGVNAMLLGENNATLFLSSSNPGLAAVSLSNSSIIWQRGDTATLVAAFQDGSVLVESGTQSIIDPYGTAAPFSGGASISNSRHAGGDYWAGKDAAGNLGLIADGKPPTQPGVMIQGSSLQPTSTGAILPDKLAFAASTWPFLFGKPHEIVERPPKHGDTLQHNYNAIEFATQLPPQSVFSPQLTTYADSLEAPTNDIVKVVSFMPVDGVPGVGFDVVFQFKNIVKDWLQPYFTVRVKRFEPNTVEPGNYLFSAVTMSDHPLAGWRFWRVKPNGAGLVVVETGAVDRPVCCMPWLANHIGFKNDQLTIWKEMFISIGDVLGVPRANDPNYGNEKLNGNFGPNDYVPPLDYILTGICGPGPGGFCRP